ncbi:P-loop containing nucleoside triphosphate hydrolase protein [Lasiosphaeris hirsuta]|uniref:P-loop containing nucleoside triphosphate hydrolase protein n=1 Tax=Lasiosphaeris hirsuta TaxID=260670 RepID=A0AA40A1R6_9PEZI|nr:P-loop containing nucleoside triphosphate hydrolase protein [Lasiosphaeris hirsuta]
MTSFISSEQKKDVSMVVVMGVTGAGKSNFINTLAGKEVTEEGDSLYACTLIALFDSGTQSCKLIPVKIGGTTVLIIDTPGFDEAERSDAEILSEIARLLAAQYKLGVELKGIVYIHRITDIRFTGSAVKTFEIFKKMCGEKPLKNVMLVTSRWSEVNEVLGSRREGELRERFWSYMLDHGSNMSRFYGDRDSAVILISQLLNKAPIVLNLQRELVDDGKSLKNTSAGSYVYDELELLKGEHRETLADLARLRKESARSKAQKRRIESDATKAERKLRQAEDQQVSLDRQIAAEVDEGIARESRTWSFSKVLPFVLPFLSLVLHVLSGILGVPMAIPI